MERDVTELLLDTIVRSFSPFPVDPRREAINQEIAAYKKLHPQLIKTHLGQHVAISSGQLVDSDADPVALLQRIRQNFPNQTVLRRQVKQTDTPEIQMRRPQIHTSS